METDQASEALFFLCCICSVFKHWTESKVQTYVALSVIFHGQNPTEVKLLL